ncbi:MAG: hypothetical protein J6P03_08400, partial [Opitutales bacterium]|nr:hypothetical protein [Opitutales bacterium]
DLAVNSGLMAALFGTCSLGISKFRAKFVNPSAFCAIWLTWGVNMAMFLICALFVFKRGVSPAGAYFLRAVLDALFTSMFIVAFAAFAVNLHKSAAVLSGDSVLVKGEE